MKSLDKLALCYIGMALAVLSLICSAVQAQTSNKPNKKMLEELIRNVDVRVEDLSLPSQTQSPPDIRVRWQGEPATSPAGAATERQIQPRGSFAALSRQGGLGSLPRQRAPELSSDQLLVLAVDAQQQLKGWALITDPRILRAELPGPTGELSGRVIYQSNVEFVVALPDDPAISELRFYHPRWTGKEFVLDPIGAAPLQ
jgi:hypothetical protein